LKLAKIIERKTRLNFHLYQSLSKSGNLCNFSFFVESQGQSLPSPGWEILGLFTGWGRDVTKKNITRDISINESGKRSLFRSVQDGKNKRFNSGICQPFTTVSGFHITFLFQAPFIHNGIL